MPSIPPANLVIMIVTALFSWQGFRDRAFTDKFIFHPESILARKEYYRLITSGFLHANWTHLGANLFSLYFFGPMIEAGFGVPNFLLIYFGSMIGGDLLSLWIHRHHDYRALGASGAVCGIIYAGIFLFPGMSLSLFLIPIWIPAWLYAILFFLFSFYGLKSQRDNIGHDAHLGGAICGLLITTALYPGIVRLSPKLFAAVMALSLALLVYLIWNPLWLPFEAFRKSNSERSPSRPRRPFWSRPKDDASRVDALLEKISRRGLDSLTEEERAFLQRKSREGNK